MVGLVRGLNRFHRLSQVCGVKGMLRPDLGARLFECFVAACGPRKGFNF